MSPPRIRLQTGTTYFSYRRILGNLHCWMWENRPYHAIYIFANQNIWHCWEPEVSQFFWNQGQALNRSPRSTGKLRHCHGKHISQQGSSIRKWVKDLSRNLRPKSNSWLPAIPAMNYHSDSLSKIRSGICMIETYVEHLKGHAFY